MKLKFSKMHGAGNDFIVIDAINQPLDLASMPWQKLADRHFGIGADQILVVQKSDVPGVDFRYRIFNADGSEVEQCGNGSRAFVKFVRDAGLTDKHSIRVVTMSGVIEPCLQPDGMVQVNMGPPRLTPAEVPFDSTGLMGRGQGASTVWPLDVAGQMLGIGVVSMGNPHAVQVVADVDAAAVAQQGPLIEHHVRFPQRVNAGFMQIIDRQHAKVRVYERGAGETLACGTGACAAAVTGILRGLLDSPVAIEMRGGTLSIAWAGEGQPVLMSGPAVTVFQGEIEI
jgi:diaminopimelate epimerase